MSDTLTAETEKVAKELGLNELVNVYHALIEQRPPRQQFDAVYLFGNTKDNEQGVFQRAGNLFEYNGADVFLISQGIAANGFPGYDNWEAGLSQYVPKNLIQPVPIKNPTGVNTFSESVALMDYVTINHHYILGIISAQFHCLRAFMTAASQAIRRNENVKIHAMLGAEQPWDEVVYHSQGTLKSTRRDLVRTELERIKRYQNDRTADKKPSIEPTKEIINYLKSY